MIPGVDPERRVFGVDSVEYCLTEEWQSITDIIGVLLPNPARYEIYNHREKVRRTLFRMMEEGRAERVNVNQSNGRVKPNYKYRRIEGSERND